MADQQIQIHYHQSALYSMDFRGDEFVFLVLNFARLFRRLHGVGHTQTYCCYTARGGSMDG